jgi:hypothetical protein
VQVAVFPGRQFAGRLDAEARFRRLAGLQELSADVFAIDHLNPLDEMFLFHGVGDASDLHFDAVRGLFNDRDVLFPGSVDCVFGNQVHRLAAADKLSTAHEKDFDHIAAQSAFINL